jgi:hypothetical protein
MNKNIFDNIIDICALEIGEAQQKLDTENLKPFDQQYQIGRKLAAKDIMRKVEELKRETQI